MSLDLHKIASQIEEVASNLNAQEADRASRLERAFNTLSTAQPEALEEKRALSRATFLIAGLKGSLAGRYLSPALPSDYTVLAVDGSYDDAFDLCVTACTEFGWYNRNTGYNPYMTGNRSPLLPTREELSDNQVCNWGKMSHFRQK